MRFGPRLISPTPQAPQAVFSPPVSPRSPVYECYCLNQGKGMRVIRSDRRSNRRTISPLALTPHLVPSLLRRLQSRQPSTGFSRQSTTMDLTRFRSQVPAELVAIGPEVRLFPASERTRLTFG